MKTLFVKRVFICSLSVYFVVENREIIGSYYKDIVRIVFSESNVVVNLA